MVKPWRSRITACTLKVQYKVWVLASSMVLELQGVLDNHKIVAEKLSNGKFYIWMQNSDQLTARPCQTHTFGDNFRNNRTVLGKVTAAILT